MPFQKIFYPFGFPVRIRSNAQTVLESANQSWGECRQTFDEAPVEARYLICRGYKKRAPQPVCRAQFNIFTMVADEHNYACGDLVGGFGSAWLTEGASGNADYFRYTFLEGLVYVLLESLHLVSVHAACVIRNGRGVLLAADSGMGKSSLAYACACRGWTYVSDDASSLVRGGTGRRVIGDPRLFRFRPTAVNLFPELQEKVQVNRKRTKFRRGKPTVEVRTERFSQIATAEQAVIDHIFFLRRDRQMNGSVRMRPVSREEAARRLLPAIWPTELPVHQERSAALERLLDANIAELSYSNFEPAIDVLESVVSRGSI